MKEIHIKIKSIRLLKKLKQEDVAQALGMSKANYSRIEKGDVALTPEKLEKLQEVFDMTGEEILSHETAQERLGLASSSTLEETVKQQAAQIERMKANTENFLDALIKHFQQSLEKSTIDGEPHISDVISEVFKIEGLSYILNKDNTNEDFPLLDAFEKLKKAQSIYTAGVFVEALTRFTEQKIKDLIKKK